MRCDKIKEKYHHECNCLICGSPMVVYDVDYQFKGCEDIYGECSNENCHEEVFIKIRFGKIFSEEFTDEEGNIRKVIKYNIDELNGKEFE